MNYESFCTTLGTSTPPAGCSDLLRALWYAGKDDWDAAHSIAQDVPTKEGNWVHAYLHRAEGDEWNAGYWYRQAGRPKPGYGLDEEWEELVRYFLEKG